MTVHDGSKIVFHKIFLTFLCSNCFLQCNTCFGDLQNKFFDYLGHSSFTIPNYSAVVNHTFYGNWVTGEKNPADAGLTASSMMILLQLFLICLLHFDLPVNQEGKGGPENDDGSHCGNLR